MTRNGGDITALCLALGYPKPDVRWIIEPSYSTRTDDNVLTFHNTQSHNNPLGHYNFSCIVNNSIDIYIDILVLEVLEPTAALGLINDKLNVPHLTLEESITYSEVLQTLSYVYISDNGTSYEKSAILTLSDGLVLVSNSLSETPILVEDNTIMSLVQLASNIIELSPHRNVSNTPNNVRAQNTTDLQIKPFISVVSSMEVLSNILSQSVLVRGRSTNSDSQPVFIEPFISESVSLAAATVPQQFLKENDSLDFKVPSLLHLILNALNIIIPTSIFSSERDISLSYMIIKPYEQQRNSNVSSEEYMLNSILVSVVSNFTKEKFSDPISLDIATYNTSHAISGYESIYKCGFLNLSGQIFSFEGVNTASINEHYVTCNVSHLTSFGVLIRNKRIYYSVIERTIISSITYILLSLSLICLVLSFIASLIVAKKFFKIEMNRIYFNLNIALMLAIAVFIFGVQTAKDDIIACSIITFLLHYFWLTVFSWGMCISFEIVYVFWINPTAPRKLFWYLLIIAWVLPIPIVVITVGVAASRSNYVSVKGEIREHCFLSFNGGTAFGFFAPVLVMLAINIIGLILAMFKIFMVFVNQLKSEDINHKIGTNAITQGAKKALIRSAILTPVLGIPWIILPFNLILTSVYVSTVFEWLFLLLIGPVGIVYFILFTVRNATVYEFFTKKCRKAERSSLNRYSAKSWSRAKSRSINASITSHSSATSPLAVGKPIFFKSTSIPKPFKHNESFELSSKIPKPVKPGLVPDILPAPPDVLLSLSTHTENVPKDDSDDSLYTYPSDGSLYNISVPNDDINSTQNNLTQKDAHVNNFQSNLSVPDILRLKLPRNLETTPTEHKTGIEEFDFAYPKKSKSFNVRTKSSMTANIRKEKTYSAHSETDLNLPQSQQHPVLIQLQESSLDSPLKCINNETMVASAQPTIRVPSLEVDDNRNEKVYLGLPISRSLTERSAENKSPSFTTFLSMRLSNRKSTDDSIYSNKGIGQQFDVKPKLGDDPQPIERKQSPFAEIFPSGYMDIQFSPSRLSFSETVMSELLKASNDDLLSFHSNRSSTHSATNLALEEEINTDDPQIITNAIIESYNNSGVGNNNINNGDYDNDDKAHT